MAHAVEVALSEIGTQIGALPTPSETNITNRMTGCWPICAGWRWSPTMLHAPPRMRPTWRRIQRRAQRLPRPDAACRPLAEDDLGPAVVRPRATEADAPTSSTAVVKVLALFASLSQR
jgi:hypothetical protein